MSRERRSGEKARGIYVSMSAYRLRNPTAVVIRERDRFRLSELSAGSVILSDVVQPDANGMIEGTCKGASVLVFFRDLEDKAELLEIDVVQSLDSGREIA